jgi:hypothetical protein
VKLVRDIDEIAECRSLGVGVLSRLLFYGYWHRRVVYRGSYDEVLWYVQFSGSDNVLLNPSFLLLN